MSKPLNFAQKLWPAAAWSVAPALWALNTQLSQILPSAECTGSMAVWSLAAYSSVALLLAVAMGLATYRGTEGKALASKHDRAETDTFIAYGGALLNLLFAFALLLQSAASWTLSPCRV